MATSFLQSLQYVKQADETLHLLFETLCLLGRYDDALRIARDNIWGHRPFTSEWVRAFKNMNSGNHVEALRDFRMIAERGHSLESAYALYYLGRCYLGMNQPQNAIQAFEKLQSGATIRNVWEYARTLYWTGRAYEMNGNPAKAKEYYGKFSPSGSQQIQAFLRSSKHGSVSKVNAILLKHSDSEKHWDGGR